MKRKCILILLVTIVLFVSCFIEKSPSSKAAVTFGIHFGMQRAIGYIETITVTAYSGSVENDENIINTDTFSEYATSVTIILPAANDIVLKVEAFDADGVVLFSGTSEQFDIVAGETKEITITMNIILPSGGYRYFAYIVNWNTQHTILTSAWDQYTGTIDFSGGTSIEEADLAPHGVGVHPNGLYAYVSTYDNTKDTVRNASIERGTGLLTLGETTTTGLKPTSVVVHPTLDVAYVSSISTYPEPSYIYVHSVNTDGTLGAGAATTTSSPFPHRIALHPNGKFLYVANEDSTVQIQIFSIDQDTGALTWVDNVLSSYYANGSVPGISIHPNGTFAYATYDDLGLAVTTCVRFTVDPTTGLLSDETELVSVEGPPTNVYEAVDVGPLGEYLYITNWQGQGIDVYTIDDTTGDITYQQTYEAGNDPHTNVSIGKIPN